MEYVASVFIVLFWLFHKPTKTPGMFHEMINHCSKNNERQSS